MTPLNPADVASLLPVGMLANTDITNPAAQALDALARRKAGQPQWEPFHYEKITVDEFEVNGAVPVLAGGVKRFPEPHYSVVVSLQEVADELQRRTGPASTASQAPAQDIAPDCLTVVLQLPADAAGRQRIIDAFQAGTGFFGAAVRACAPHDAIALSQALARLCPEEQVRRLKTGIDT